MCPLQIQLCMNHDNSALDNICKAFLDALGTDDYLSLLGDITVLHDKSLHLSFTSTLK